MDDIERVKTAAQIKRAMPSNRLVLGYIDKAEERMASADMRIIELEAEIEKMKRQASTAKVDRKTYMREYMREKRAGAKAQARA